MNPSLLLDTNAILRWLVEPRKLSRDQERVLREADRRRERLAISAMTLFELALLLTEDRRRINITLGDFLDQLQNHPSLDILPITIEIAKEVAALPSLRDPADRAIVATARVHRLRLLTSDQRIIESKLANVIE